MRRLQARRGNGRFTRNMMENTFGLHAGIHERKASGEWCGSFNPSRVGEPRPTHCHACGEPLSADAVDPHATSTGTPSTREKSLTNSDIPIPVKGEQ